MTKQMNRYYYYDEHTKNIFYSTQEQTERFDLIYLGETENPNVRMAATSFAKQLNRSFGHRVIDLD